MPGRRIFKITATPFGSFARCTCAIEAAAKGSRSRSTKTSKGERPSACSTCGQSSSKETGVAWLCSAASSVVHAGGRRSSRVESIWPSLTKVGPSSSNGKPDALLRFKMSDVARFAPMQDLAGALEQRDDAGATHHIAQPMPDQDRADLAQAWQVPDRAGDAPDHER